MHLMTGLLTRAGQQQVLKLNVTDQMYLARWASCRAALVGVSTEEQEEGALLQPYPPGTRSTGPSPFNLLLSSSLACPQNGPSAPPWGFF